MPQDPFSITLTLATLSAELRTVGAADLPALSAFCDAALAHDWFFRKGHLERVVRDPKQQVYVVIVDEQIVGLVVLYEHTTLHNLFIAPAYRGTGIGSAVMRVLNPSAVRAKTNMSTGDPSGFYSRLGFSNNGVDPRKPHIGLMVKTPRVDDQRELTKQKGRERSRLRRARQRAEKQASKENSDAQDRVQAPISRGPDPQAPPD